MFGDFKFDLILYLDIDFKFGLECVCGCGELDCIEKMDISFFECVCECYFELVNSDDFVVMIDVV